MKIEFGGHTYHLRTELTGQDFLDLRSKGLGPDGKVDMTAYGHINLVKRLASWDWDKELNDENIKALPMKHYQVLFNASIRLEAEEGSEATNFLLELWETSKPVELSSTLALSSRRGRSGQGASTGAEN